jgi:hypothetical protein
MKMRMLRRKAVPKKNETPENARSDDERYKT